VLLPLGSLCIIRDLWTDDCLMKAAKGEGIVTGFFLHRSEPPQEIDIEIIGKEPGKMLLNAYFNPGNEGTQLDYGYRGSPVIIDFGFDASSDFHKYTIEWLPDRIRWFVDDMLVHERGSWNPTPIPHLAMTLHANLWSPRSFFRLIISSLIAMMSQNHSLKQLDQSVH
jgi:beta-glucanase (GH16 family)